MRGPANGALRRVLASHVAAVVAEWASVVGALVYAYERGGATATGIASLCVLAPSVAGAPIAAALVNGRRPAMVRLLGLAAQGIGYGLAAGAIALDLPVAAVVAPIVFALIALCTLRPTGAVLLPALARSSSELTQGALQVAYCDNASALVGPLTAAALLWAGGPSAVLAACAALAGAGFVATLGAARHGPPAARADEIDGARRGWRRSIDHLRSRPWTLRIFATIWVRCALIGALDVLTVLLAFDALDLGSGGPGLLTSLVGVGALLSAALTTVVVRRSRLAPAVLAAVGGAAVLCAVLAAVTEVATAIVVLPLLGAAASMIDGLARMLVQRSVDPRTLASAFVAVEFVAGVGVLAGSGIAQLLVLAGGTDAALYGMAALFLLVLVSTARSLWRADATADVPIVEMSLLARLPMFAPMQPLALEAVARVADHISVADGEVVVRQGDHGDRFYAVVDGSFDVVMSGEHIRAAERASCFGEVALLADVPRTATVTARGAGHLLAVERVPFLTAVTGSDTSTSAAWGVVHAMDLDGQVPRPE